VGGEKCVVYIQRGQKGYSGSRGKLIHYCRRDTWGKGGGFLKENSKVPRKSEKLFSSEGGKRENNLQKKVARKGKKFCSSLRELVYDGNKKGLSTQQRDYNDRERGGGRESGSVRERRPGDWGREEKSVLYQSCREIVWKRGAVLRGGGGGESLSDYAWKHGIEFKKNP